MGRGEGLPANWTRTNQPSRRENYIQGSAGHRSRARALDANAPPHSAFSERTGTTVQTCCMPFKTLQMTVPLLMAD
jgi:hypothetical protein